MKRKLKMKKPKMIFTAIILALGCFAFLPQMQAVSPTPDGCYPNYTTAEGCNALQNLMDGAGNTGVGWYSLFSDSSGGFNTGVGGGALALNNADSNTAVGAGAMLLNTTGYENVAVGTNSLVFNDSGYRNTALGAFTLTNNTDGFTNTAVGRCVLTLNVTGSGNTGLGAFALLNNDSSGSGTASFNTAVGDSALMNNVDGDYITALGANAGTDPGLVRNNIYIGDPGFAGDENVISIGGISASGTDYAATFIGGIYGASVNTGTALPVYIDTDGHLGTTLVNASGNKVRARTQGAQPQAMLKEFQKQQKRIADLEATVARLTAMVTNQAAQIQKVSAQVQMNNASPQVVTNNQ